MEATAQADPRTVTLELIGKLLRTATRALLAGLAVAVLIYSVIADYLLGPAALFWLGLYTAVTLVRLFMTRRQIRCYKQHPQRAGTLYTLGALAGGVAWSTLILLYDPASPQFVQLLLLVTLVGMPAASMPTTASYLPSYYAFSMPIFAALFAWAIWMVPEFNVQIAMMAAVYAALVTAVAHNYFQTLKQNIERNEENKQLLQVVRASNQKLAQFAYTDPLTQLSNRRQFEEDIERLLRHARASGAEVALMLVDMDGFKWVNDTLGHEAGDELLKTIARRISNVSRHSELLALEKYEAARIGGDEFVVLYQLQSPGNTAIIAERVFGAVTRQTEIAGTRYTPSVSIGVAVAPTDADNMTALLKCADEAMYRVKANGGGAVAFHAVSTAVPLRDDSLLSA